MGLYKLYAYNQEALSSQLMHPNALDGMPVILTTCGLLPSLLFGCSAEAVGAILTLSYCAGAAALLHAKIEKNKWEQLDGMLIKNISARNLSDKINMNIPDNFMRAVDLKFAGMQRRATQIYEQADKDIEALRAKQYSYACKDQYYIHPVSQYDIQSKAHESVDSMIRKNINQVLELDEAALSRIDRENRMTQQFDIEFVRNEENTSRVMKRVEK